MIESNAEYIQGNPDGSFTVPRSLVHLVKKSAGVHYNHHTPTFVRFSDEGDPNEVFANFEGDPTVAQSIIDMAWIYGRGLYEACEANLPIDVIGASYHTAAANIDNRYR